MYWKNFALTVLTVFLLCCSAPAALAADNPFSDVKESDYNYSQIMELYHDGIVSGYGAGQFAPRKSVSHAEALTMICRVAAVKLTEEKEDKSPWYAAVRTWAIDNGIQSAAFSGWTKPATREEICSYMTRVYQMDISQTKTNAFSDSRSPVANTLYDKGVVAGSNAPDGSLLFRADSNVTRGDTCILLSRLREKATAPDWNAAEKLDFSYYATLHVPATLQSRADYADLWAYMMVNKISSYDYRVDQLAMSKAELDVMGKELLFSYNVALRKFAEYSSFYNQSTAGYNYSGSTNRIISVTFHLELSDTRENSADEIARQVMLFESRGQKLVRDLYASGKLTAEMTQKEKAAAILSCVKENVSYDDALEKRNGYDAVIDGKSVCQGYVALYNYLCHLAGVPMEAVDGKIEGRGAHIWCRVEENGVWRYVDPTWADTDSAGNWFWVSAESLKTGENRRTWTEEE